MTGLLIAAIVVFVGGLLASYKMFGLIPSISDNYYYLEEKKKGLGIIFTIWCWLIAFLIAPVSFEILKEYDYQFLGLFTSFGLMLVGAAPKFKTTEKVIHVVGAAICATSATLTGFLLGNWYVIAPITLACIYIYKKTKADDTVYWLEDAAFVSYFVISGIHLWVK